MFTFQGKETADVITLRLWRWEEELDYSGGPNIITRVLKRSAGVSRVHEGDMKIEAEMEQSQTRSQETWELLGSYKKQRK